MPKTYTEWYNEAYGEYNATLRNENSTSTFLKMRNAERAAWKIIADLNDRKGFHVNDLDDELQDEIFATFVEIIDKEFT